MIDFHTHILPGIDDGSRDMDMTAAMLREEASQGTDTIVFTPHFYADRMSVSHFLEARENALDKVQKWYSGQGVPFFRVSEPGVKKDDPVFMAGAEVYYFPGIGSAQQLPELCVTGTNTLLLEMPFSSWSDNVLSDVKQILRKQELTVVLAHIERYYEFQKNKNIWREVFSLPVIPQINTGSFIPESGFFHRRRRQKFCLDFLMEHPNMILGSDAHNMTSRPVNIAKGREEIRAALGEDALENIDRTTEEVLGL